MTDLMFEVVKGLMMGYICSAPFVMLIKYYQYKKGMIK